MVKLTNISILCKLRKRLDLSKRVIFQTKSYNNLYLPFSLCGADSTTTKLSLSATVAYSCSCSKKSFSSISKYVLLKIYD